MIVGGGSANKTYLYQQTKALLNPNSLMKFLEDNIKTMYVFSSSSISNSISLQMIAILNTIVYYIFLEALPLAHLTTLLLLSAVSLRNSP